jgi:hypothetical protein
MGVVIGLALTVVAFVIVATLTFRWVILPLIHRQPQPQPATEPLLALPDSITRVTGGQRGTTMPNRVGTPSIMVVEPQAVQRWIDEATQNLRGGSQI